MSENKNELARKLGLGAVIDVYKRQVKDSM